MMRSLCLGRTASLAQSSVQRASHLMPSFVDARTGASRCRHLLLLQERLQNIRPARSYHHMSRPLSTAANTKLARKDDSSNERSGSGSSGTTSRYAVVDHSAAYEASMKGRHGQQLALATLEGIGKDDRRFDPFLEDDLEEKRRMMEEEEEDDDDDDDDDENDQHNEPQTKEGKEGEDGDDDYHDDGDDYDEVDHEFLDFKAIYNRDGSLRRPKSEIAILRAGAPAGGVFAIIELAGTQHKVTTDDVVVVNLLKPVERYSVGSVHTLKDVMLAGSSHLTLVGMPHVAGAEVDFMVEEITKDAKVTVFKRRRRKNYRRKKGFRRDVTMLRILDIRLPAPYSDHEHVERIVPGSLT